MVWGARTVPVCAVPVLTTCKDDWRTGGLGQYGMVTTFAGGGRLGDNLQHDHTDLFHTLSDGLRNASKSDGLLSRAGEHFPCHLDLNPCTLSYFLDLATTFPNESYTDQQGPSASG